MIIKKLPFLMAFVCAISLLSCRSNAHDGEVYVELRPLQTASGWGYEIYVDKKLYIRQEYIPVISGKHAFNSKEDAMKTGKVVMDKLEHGKVPTITTAELKDLQIIQ